MITIRETIKLPSGDRDQVRLPSSHRLHDSRHAGARSAGAGRAIPADFLGVEPAMNNARRTALLRASALSVAVAALAAACSSTNSSSNSSSSTSQSVSTSSPAVASSGSDLVIGTIGNFSGPGGEASHLAGLQAWVDSVNASGGIKGRQIKLIVEDDQGDATTSQADIRQLVRVDHVLAIVSPEAGGTESGWASY